MRCLGLKEKLSKLDRQAAIQMIKTNAQEIVRSFLQSQIIVPVSFKDRLEIGLRASKVISGEDLARLVVLTEFLRDEKQKDAKRDVSLLGFSLLNHLTNGTGLDVVTPEECDLKPILRSESKIDPSLFSEERISAKRQELEKEKALAMLKAKPMVPSQEYKLDGNEMKRYLDHFCPDSRLGRQQTTIIADILKHTKTVSHDEFHRLLDQVIQQVLNQLGGASWTPGWLVAGKSNFWVLQMVLEMSPTLKSQMQIDPPARNLVFWDDALYSGRQMGNVLGSSHITIDQRVFVAAPFISQEAMDKIHKAFSSVQILYAQKLFPMSAQSVNWKNETKGLEQFHALVKDLYPIILNHKMPDFMSSYPEIYSGFVPALPPDSEDLKECPKRVKPATIPFLKGCEKIFQSYFAQHPPEDVFEFHESHDECPRRPYEI